MSAITLKFRKDGAVSSLQYDGVEFASTPKPLFVFQVRDFSGKPLQFSSEIFPEVDFEESAGKTTIRFSGDNRFFRPGGATVTVEKCGDDLRWGISLDVHDDLVEVEWIDFPVVHLAVPSNFRYLSTYAEGMLVAPEGLGCIKRLCGPTMGAGYIGYAPSMIRYFYPGPASAQFHGVFQGDCGLYIGFEDREDSLKLMEVNPEDDGTCTLLQQQFTGGKNCLDYQIVMRGFRGDWQRAAEFQRQWLEAGKMPEKLRGAMPAWYDRDPLMLIYPVRGEGLDHYAMTGNRYFPYRNGLEVVKKYHDLLPGCPMMPLLMHWEGTAPWAPPFVWPPYGGEECLQEFTDALHAQGDMIGLYASGIGWTQVSAIDHDYDCTRRFQEEHVDREICVGPSGERYSNICNHALVGQRVGFDLCPSREYTRKVVEGEVGACQAHGIDYLQYFDQNCGGGVSPCYSRDHGHPHLPGPWIAKAVAEMMEGAVSACKDTLAVGCENTAAFPYAGLCRLNDIRNMNAWISGEPVPLYSYLLHEYSLGFSGNTCGFEWYCDYKKEPYFLNLHFAWHFVFGNMLALVTNGDGLINWAWGTPWKVEPPEQETILTLMRNLLGWRHGVAKEFLLYGRMEAAPQVSCQSILFPRKEVEGECRKPAVLAATWEYQGRRMTILVNYTKDSQRAAVGFPQALQNGRLLATGQEPQEIQGQEFVWTVPALDAILIQH